MDDSKDESSSSGTNWLAWGCCGCLGLVLLWLLSIAVTNWMVSWGTGRNDDAPLRAFSQELSDPMIVEAVARARSDSRFVEALGEPIETGLRIGGEVNTSGNRGTAHLMIPITGPKGSGQIEAEAVKPGDHWELRVLKVQLRASGEVIELLGEAPGLDQPEGDLEDLERPADILS